MAVKNIVAAIPLTSISAAAFTGAYQLINTLPQACIILRIINFSNVGVTISYDGTTDHDFVAPEGVVLLEFQTNALPNTLTAALPKGTKIFFKAGAGAGTVYVAGYYQPQQ